MKKIAKTVVLYGSVVASITKTVVFYGLLVASITKDPGIAARALANIADVLGSMAGSVGGLRSGPAANQSWRKAFNYLEV